MMTAIRRSFHWADYLVFVAMLLTSSAIGIFYAFMSRRHNSSGEFMLASRTMGFFPVTMSLMATLFTGIFLQGSVSEAYFRGILLYTGTVIPFAIGGAISGVVFMPKFYQMELKSVYQYIGLRFNGAVQYCCLFIGYIYMILVSGGATRAAALVLTTVTGSQLSVLSSTIILSAVCTFYTVIGGMKAVIWADVFQMCLIFSCLIATVIKAAVDLGFYNIWMINLEGGRFNVVSFDPDPRDIDNFWSVFIGGIFTWLTLLTVLPHQAQRYVSCKSQTHAHISFGLYIAGSCVIVLLCTLCGMVIYANYVDCDPLSDNKLTDPDGLLPYYILDAFNDFPGLPGLFVSGLCSAALSTTSSVLNSVATVTGEHIVTKIWKNLSDSRYLLITRILVLLFGGFNIATSLFVGQLGNLLRAIIGLIGVTNAPVCAVFILGFFFRRANAKGTLIGFVVGTAAGMWLFIGSLFYQPLAPNLPVSTDGCEFDYVTDSVTNASVMITVMSLINMSTTVAPDVSSRPFIIELYNISRLWYTTICVLIVVVVSLVASLIFDAMIGKPEVDSYLLWSWREACSCKKENSNKPEQKSLFDNLNNDATATATTAVEADINDDTSFTTHF